MGASPDELVEEIERTRGRIDRRVDVLRDRARRTVRRTVPVGVASVAGAAALLAGAFAMRAALRRRRPASRVARALPAPVRNSVRRTRKQTRRSLRETAQALPPVRIFVGERAVKDERATTKVQQLGMVLAKSAGAAAGASLAGRVTSRDGSGKKPEKSR